MTIIPTSAFGLPQFTAAECNHQSRFEGDWHGTGKSITYYVENTFATEMQACLNNLLNTPGWVADLQQFHVTTALQHAAEIWNAQSRGMLLKYGGTTSIGSGENACGLGSAANPAVLITFEAGCLDDSGTCQQAAARVTKPNGCDHVTWIRFFGNDTVRFACPINSQLNEFSIGRSVGNTDLVGVAVHEFGHVLNLGDNPPNAANNTLMDNTISNASDRRHLKGWDQDCVDEADINNGRQVYYNWLTLNYLGGVGSSSSHTSPTSRGMLSGGYQWDNSIPYTIYGLFLAGTQSLPNRSIQFGLASYAYSTFPYSSPFAPATLDTSPVFFRAGEKSYAQEGSRMNYLARLSTSEDPPRSQTRWSTDIFATNTPNQAQMSGKRGDMPTSLSSHIPSTTAFDPVSGKTIFVHVNTATGNRSIYGDIWVHPGFKEPHFNYTLAEGFRLGAGGVPAMPASPFPTSGTCSPANTCWNYSPKTDVAVGVACGDNTIHFPYNCLLAWQDFSVPTGRVLYTYFRVNTSGGTTVEFHPNAWARGGSQTVSSISAAYFAGKYYMAWKKTTAPARVTRNINDSTSYTGWGTPIDHTPTNHLADPPLPGCIAPDLVVHFSGRSFDMKLWITTLLLLCVATACESEPERAAYLTFSESGLSGSSCDGPCVPVIIDACVVSGPKQHIVIARMAGSSRDFPSTPNSCNPTPPDKYYASPYRKARMVVEETLFGKFKRGEEVEALFLGRWASSLSWQKDDHLFVVLRENQGEWFAYPSYTVELHSGDFQEGDGHDVGDVVFDFPSKISDLKAQLADVNQNYPTRCDYTPMTDAEFEYGVRHDNNCDFVGDDTQDIDDSGTDISGR